LKWECYKQFIELCKPFASTSWYLCHHHSTPVYMSVVTVLIVLIVVGVILWLINTYIPMDRKIKNILNIVVVILVVLWLLRAFGVLDSLNTIRL